MPISVTGVKQGCPKPYIRVIMDGLNAILCPLTYLMCPCSLLALFFQIWIMQMTLHLWLLAPTLQHLIDDAAFCNLMGMIISVAKTKIMVFNLISMLPQQHDIRELLSESDLARLASSREAGAYEGICRREITGVRTSTPTAILLAELGLQALSDEWLLRAAKFWNNLQPYLRTFTGAWHWTANQHRTTQQAQELGPCIERWLASANGGRH